MSIIKIADKLPNHLSFIKRRTADLFIIPPDGLNQRQHHGVALTTAYHLKNAELLNSIKAEAKLVLEETDSIACKAALTMTTFAGIYAGAMARVAPNEPIIANLFPDVYTEVDARDFGIYCLTASVLRRDDYCIHYHFHSLLNVGVGPEVLNAVSWTAALLSTVAEALEIEQLRTSDFLTRRATM